MQEKDEEFRREMANLREDFQNKKRELEQELRAQFQNDIANLRQELEKVRSESRAEQKIQAQNVVPPQNNIPAKPIPATRTSTTHKKSTPTFLKVSVNREKKKMTTYSRGSSGRGSTGSAEPVNFERKVLEPFNFSGE